jgi:hypothetical protein
VRTATTLVGGVQAWALGDGPAFQDAVEFEPEIVVETGRIVFLDDEGRLAAVALSLFRTFGAVRFRCAREVAFLAIGFEEGPSCGRP